MENICKRFHQTSEYISLWLTTQPNVNEQSLTDWLLYRISIGVQNIFYHSFSRAEEGKKTGADWEWWILFPQTYVRFRIQAKKLSVSGDNYKKIAYKNKNGLQIHRFLEDSKQVNAISLYALYIPAINYDMCNGQENSQKEGVFFAGGQQIYNAFISGSPMKVEATDILKISRPFSCFACCPLITANSGGLKHYLKQYFQLEMTSGSPDSNNFRGLHTHLPSYLSSFIEHTQNIPEWWEGEFAHEIHDFNALVVYDFRDQNSESKEIEF